MNPTLKLLKAGRLAARIEGDDLAVEDGGDLRRASPLFECGGDFRKLLRFLVAQPRPQAYHAMGLSAARGDRPPDLRDRADAVVFGLADKLRIGERGVSQRRQHRAENF